MEKTSVKWKFQNNCLLGQNKEVIAFIKYNDVFGSTAQIIHGNQKYNAEIDNYLFVRAKMTGNEERFVAYKEFLAVSYRIERIDFNKKTTTVYAFKSKSFFCFNYTLEMQTCNYIFKKKSIFSREVDIIGMPNHDDVPLIMFCFYLNYCASNR